MRRQETEPEPGVGICCELRACLRCLLLLSLIFEIPAASASNWVVIATPDKNTEGSMLLDKDSVTFEGDKRTAWFKLLLNSAAPAAPKSSNWQSVRRP